MTAWIADLVFAAVVLLAALLVRRGGAVRSGVRLPGLILAGLLAMNYFEPMAKLVIDLGDDADFLLRFARFASLIGLLASAVIVLWALTGRLLPESPELPPLVERVAGWTCSLLGGYVLAAVLLTAVHTFPGPREFGGFFPPEADRRKGPLLKFAPDYQWLGFTQHVSEHVLLRPGNDRVFDGPQRRVGNVRGRWPSFPLRYAQWRSQFDSE